ncbi:MAG: RimK family alpha-L-glutamate ligase [Candidatus Bathyarchaeia archaeon]
MQAMIVYGRALDRNNKQLYEACKKFVGKTILARIMDMSTYISPQESRFWVGDKEIKNVAFCFLRSFGPGSGEQLNKRVSLMEHFAMTNAPVINSPEALQKVRNKFLTACMLKKAGLPIPKTYLTEMSHWAYRMSRNFKQTIYKPLVGSLGFGSMKFEDVDMAFNAYKTLEQLGQPIHIQEYLENPGKDIRAFVIGEQIIASIYRIAPANTWKSNVAQGSKCKPIQLSPQLNEQVLKATETLGLNYAGVDILETAEGPVFLEVNGAPSWQGLQEATSVNVAEHLVQYAVRLAKK